MNILKIKNLADDSIIIEREFSDEDLQKEIPLWKVQVELYKLEGKNSKLEIIYPESEPIPEPE